MGRYALGLRSRPREVVFTAWDPWHSGKTDKFSVATNMLSQADPTNRNLRYGWKLPCKEDGTARVYYGGTGDSATEQSNMDDALLMMRTAGMTVYVPCWYPRAADLTSVPPDGTDRGLIRDILTKSLASPNLPKFALILISSQLALDASSASGLPPLSVSGGTWLNLTAFLSDITTLIADARYWKVTAGGVSNRPVIFLFDQTPAWDATRITALRNAVTAAGFGNPYLVHNMIAAADTLDCEGTYNYGGPNKTGFGTTHMAATAEDTKDASFWNETQNGTRSLPCISMCNDGRPRAANGNDVDPRTYVQAEAILRKQIQYATSQLNSNPLGAILIANASEYDESGALTPTPQIRGLGPVSFRGPYLDAIQNVLAKTFPAPIWVAYQGRTLHTDITRHASWATLVQDLTDGGGALQYEEMRTSTASATFTIAPALACDRIVVYSSKGPGYGTMNATLDGGGPTLCTQTNGAVIRTFNSPPILGPSGFTLGAPAYDTGVLSPGAHSVVMTQVSGTVGIDLVLARITATR